MEILTHYHTFRGQRLYWLGNEVNQDKETIVFLHGFPDNASIWLNQLEYFSNGFNVIAPYVWGTYDGIQLDSEYYKCSTFSDAILDLLTSLDIKDSKVHLVAHDLGGPIAATLSTHQNFANYFLINTFTGKQFFERIKNPIQFIKSSYMLYFQLPVFNYRRLKPISALILKALYKIGKVDINSNYVKNNHFGLINWQLYRSYLFDKTTWSSDIKFPINFIWGVQDPVLILPKYNDFKKIANIKNIFKIDSSHWPQLTHANSINQILDREINNEN